MLCFLIPNTESKNQLYSGLIKTENEWKEWVA